MNTPSPPPTITTTPPTGPSSSPPISLLIINPNSTLTMTEALQPIITPLLLSNTTTTYFTAPATAPPSINDTATSTLSTTLTLPHLLPLLPHHSAIILACYSAHPLIPLLRAATTIPVIGIFEASLYHSLALLQPEGKLAIITTGKPWEALLSRGVEEVLGGKGRLAGVWSTGLDADELERVGREEVERRVEGRVREMWSEEVGVVCLGCAGMVGLREVVERVVEEVAPGRGVRVVDGVEAAVGMVGGMLGRGYERVARRK
ncbi:hypothetical protein EX30DRAFT_371689 [Ascodesmis nigricans]|uniref:DCG1-like protein n=1 Tax=Ascodesmis nigricans TaxID=341454 RepID=A0A4S2MWG9_9PEZI|nr:hypothetical protein EX30DRAFT_371689 [Ascodesmis nigricans]